MKVDKQDIEFYLKRLAHYDNNKAFFKLDITLDPGEIVRGYGEIEFAIDQKKCIWFHDFWYDAMMGFIKKELCKGCNKGKEKHA